MKKIIAIFSLILFVLTGFSQDTTNTTKQDTVTAFGIIIKTPMITKKNEPSDHVMDYFLKTGKEEFFIKLSESKTTHDILDNYINKTVNVKYIIKNGEWDSKKGEEGVQSRIGPYIIVIEIKGE